MHCLTHASLWDLNTMGSTTDNTEWEEAMAPSQADHYSPHRFVGDIQVPMLVIHGDKDYRVPISQGLQLWSDLQRHTAVEGTSSCTSRMRIHWILKPANARVPGTRRSWPSWTGTFRTSRGTGRELLG